MPRLKMQLPSKVNACRCAFCMYILVWPGYAPLVEAKSVFVSVPVMHECTKTVIKNNECCFARQTHLVEQTLLVKVETKLSGIECICTRTCKTIIIHFQCAMGCFDFSL